MGLSPKTWNIIGLIVIVLAFAGLLAFAILTGDRTGRSSLTTNGDQTGDGTDGDQTGDGTDGDQTGDGDSINPSNDADLNIGTPQQQETSASVETPQNYEFLFDDCPRGAAKQYSLIGDLTIQQCATACTAESTCVAFEVNKCDSNKNCGGGCYLFSGDTNIALPNTITRGLCGSPVVGYKKAYRKKS